MPGKKIFYILVIVLVIFILAMTVVSNYYKCSQIRYSINSIKNIPKVTLRYPSSSSWHGISTAIDGKINSVHRHFNVTANPVGSQNAKRDLINNTNDTIPFIISSNSLSEEEHKTANRNGLKLHEIPIALDGIVFVVNESNPLNQISKEQIRKIYTEEIENWNQIEDGYDERILAIYPDPRTRGTGQWVQEKILQQDHFDHELCQDIDNSPDKNVCLVQENTDGKQLVKDEENAIFFATASQTIDECNLKILKLVNPETNKPILPYSNNTSSSNMCPNKENRVNNQAFKSEEYFAIRPIFIIANFDNKKNKKIAEAYINLVTSDEIQTDIIDESGKFARFTNSKNICK